ncbi:type II secretion system F family protein [Halobellus limi]|uniref:Type II secretion system (T2SS), protein F n=1 Tax=Halobellus limi TaxID=699433 RepID=A0A1H5YYQ6_9EURY|nr:type II secretion system F family protein [Halobellus limi]QCC48284.1 type II secretion system protein [Halobellus limi]SEG29191.1 Type II secretion system (T2SS), protein F [Halobellus limi]
MTSSTATRLRRTARSLARWYPNDVESTAELHRSLAFLDSDLRADTVVRAGYVAAVPVAVLALCALLVGLPGLPVAASMPAAAGIGLGATHVIHRLPVAAATLRRTRALGDAPGLVARAALRLRLEATPERAAAFAARTGTGPLARSLGAHAERTRSGPTAGLDAFAAEWRPWFPALERSVALLSAAVEAPPDERDAALDRALETVLDGARTEMAEFAGDVRGPASGIYAFGVLLPLALVGVLPAARAGGVTVPASAFVVLYDVLLPAGLIGAGAWLLLRRPIALAPPRVTAAHPDVPSGPTRALAAGVVGAVCGFAVGSAVAAWAAPVGAVGAGTGAALTVHFRPMAAVRRGVDEAERGLADATAVVGRRVGAGESVESAIGSAATATTGRTSELFESASGVQRRLRVGVYRAFLGEYGALRHLPSRRGRATASLLAVAAEEGRPAGDTLTRLADHLTELRRVEDEARRELAAITGTLSHTAALFGPLVGGATVAMATQMAASGATAAESASLAGSAAPGAATLSPSTLGTAVGVYVLALAAVLTAVATGLDRGLDRTLVGYRIGLALLAATATYLVAFLGASMLF